MHVCRLMLLCVRCQTWLSAVVAEGTWVLLHSSFDVLAGLWEKQEVSRHCRQIQIFPVNFQAALQHEFWSFILGWGCWHLSEYTTLHCGEMDLMDAQEQSGSFWLHLSSDYLVHRQNTSSVHTWQPAARCTWLQVQTPSRRALSWPWNSAFLFAIKAGPSGVKTTLRQRLSLQCKHQS